VSPVKFPLNTVGAQAMSAQGYTRRKSSPLLVKMPSEALLAKERDRVAAPGTEMVHVMFSLGA